MGQAASARPAPPRLVLTTVACDCRLRPPTACGLGAQAPQLPQPDKFSFATHDSMGQAGTGPKQQSNQMWEGPPSRPSSETRQMKLDFSLPQRIDECVPLERGSHGRWTATTVLRREQWGSGQR